MANLFSRFCTSRRGNVAVMAALSAPLVVAGLAVSVDYAALVKQRRSEQATADLAAIAAAADPMQARMLVERYYADNGLNYAVQDESGVHMAGGQSIPSVSQLNTGKAPDCVVTVETGHYEPDPSLPVAARFQTGALTPDAVRVKQSCRGHLYFASAMMSEPKIDVAATASSRKLASYWIGSRAGSIDGGLANAVFGALFGTTVSLKVVDYNALMSANVDILSTLKTLGTNINMSAVSYNDLLDADITLAQFFKAIRVGGNVNGTVQATLRTLEATVGRSNRTIKLSQILNLASIGKQQVGTGYGSDSTADAYSLIRAAAAVSNGQHQVEINFDFTLPGIGNANFRLMVGEPPVGAQSVAINSPGSLVRTAQIRTMVTFTQGALPSLAGISLRVPIFLEVANSEARLAGIQCNANGVASVKVETYPGVAELTVGEVDQNAFINFGNKPRVTPATLISAPGVAVTGSAQVDVNNMIGSLLDFSRADIDTDKVKNVSVSTPFTSYMSSIIKNLNLNVNVGGVGLSLPPDVYRKAVIGALSNMSVPADQLLGAFMFIWGIKIGEADLAVTGASCSTPSLVL